MIWTRWEVEVVVLRTGTRDAGRARRHDGAGVAGGLSCPDGLAVANVPCASSSSKWAGSKRMRLADESEDCIEAELASES